MRRPGRSQRSALGAVALVGLVTCGAPEPPAPDPARLAVALAAHRPVETPFPPPPTGRLQSLAEELFEWLLGNRYRSTPPLMSYYLASTISWSGLAAMAPPAPALGPVLHLPADSVDEEEAWPADPSPDAP